MMLVVVVVAAEFSLKLHILPNPYQFQTCWKDYFGIPWVHAGQSHSIIRIHQALHFRVNPFMLVNLCIPWLLLTPKFSSKSLAIQSNISLARHSRSCVTASQYPWVTWDSGKGHGRMVVTFHVNIYIITYSERIHPGPCVLAACSWTSKCERTLPWGHNKFAHSRKVSLSSQHHETWDAKSYQHALMSI